MWGVLEAIRRRQSMTCVSIKTDLLKNKDIVKMKLSPPNSDKTLKLRTMNLFLEVETKQQN